MNEKNDQPPIAFTDLKTQPAQIFTALLERIQAVFVHGRYVMEPEIGELEN